MNMSDPRTPNQSQNSRTSPRRPATITELAEQALNGPWEADRELKYYLRMAERHRRQAKEYAQEEKLEEAFVEFARAATLVLEKLPAHEDYYRLLNESHRHNLKLVCISPFFALYLSWERSNTAGFLVVLTRTVHGWSSFIADAPRFRRFC